MHKILSSWHFRYISIRYYIKKINKIKYQQNKLGEFNNIAVSNDLSSGLTLFFCWCVTVETTAHFSEKKQQPKGHLKSFIKSFFYLDSLIDWTFNQSNSQLVWMSCPSMIHPCLRSKFCLVTTLSRGQQRTVQTTCIWTRSDIQSC